MTTYFYDAANNRFIDEETGAVVYQNAAPIQDASGGYTSNTPGTQGQPVDLSGGISQYLAQNVPEMAAAKPSVAPKGYSLIPGTSQYSDMADLEKRYGGGKVVKGSDGNFYAPDDILSTYSNNNRGGLVGALDKGYGVYAVMGGALGAAAAGAGALGGAAAGGSAAGLSAADLAGLTQMGLDAGLSGAGLDAFVASGGTLGSTAAGGGGLSGLLDSGGGGGDTGVAGEGGGGGGDTGSFTMQDLLNTPTGGGAPGGGVSNTYDPYALTGPSTTGTGAGLTTQPAAGAGSLGAITSGVSGLGALAGAAGGGGSPVQPGYNALDPSTYGGSGGTGGTGAAGAGNALSRILDGTASTADYLSVLGQGAATGLGIAGANAQADAYKDVYNQQMALGAPSRARYEASFQPGFSVYDDPATRDAATRSADIAARSYSAKAGNPFDNQTSQAGIYQNVLAGVGLPQLNTYRSQNLTGGQLGTNTAGTASLTGAGQSGTMYDAIGGGLGMLTQPDNGLASLMQKYKLNLGGIA